jgi:hypothetical protein
MKTKLSLTFTLLLTLVLIITSVTPAQAAAGDPVTVTGIISAITPGVNFVVQLPDASFVTIVPAAGFDYTLIAVGDAISLNGTEGVDPTSVDLVDYLVTPLEPSKQDGYFCAQSAVQHPAAAKLAARFGVEYSVVQQMFCNGAGLGNIMLALATAQASGSDPAALLTQHAAGAGWGQIWRELRNNQTLVGSPDTHGNGNGTIVNPGNGHSKPEKPNHGKKP